jgi:hypothetical protein
MSKIPTLLRDTASAWLEEQGHLTTLEVTDERLCEVRFRARGVRLAVLTDERDTGFLYIFLRASLPDGVDDELLARRAAAAVESHGKVVKVELHWEARDFIIAAEQFVETPGGASIFWRSVSVLEDALRRIYELLYEEIGRAAASEFTARLERELRSEAR